MKIIFFILIIISTTSSAQQTEILNQEFDGICNYFDQFDKVESPINSDYVESDLLIINNLNKIAFSKSTDDILSVFPNLVDGKCNCNSATYELKNDLKSTIYEIYGGYGSAKVSIIYYNNLILKLRIIIENHSEILQKFLIEKIIFPLTCVSGKPGYEVINGENLRIYEQRVGPLFLNSEDTNSKRRAALNYFSDDLANGTFSEPYFILFGLGSETFDHIRYFIVNKDYDAMKMLLSSTSPTSRLFFANTLLYMKKQFNYKIDKVTSGKIAAILKDSQPIKSGIISCWVNKFDYEYYDITKNFEKYLATE